MHRIVFSSFLFLVMAAHAHAAVIEFFDRATFNANVPGVVTFDFETASGFPAAPASLDFIDASIDLSTSGGDAVVNVSNFGNGFGQAIGGSTGGAVDNFKPVVVTFSAPYFAVGFDDLDLTQFGVVNEFAIIQVAFAGSGIQNFLRTDPDNDFSTAPFFGVWSDEQIIGLRVFSADTATGSPGTRANLIDNLSVSRTAIPEPASLWLMGLGIGFVTFLRRRRN